MKNIVLLALLFGLSLNCFSQAPQATVADGGISIKINTSWNTVAYLLDYTYTFTATQLHVKACYHVTPLLMEVSLEDNLFVPTNDPTGHEIVLSIYATETADGCDYSADGTLIYVPLSTTDYVLSSNTDVKIFPNPSNGLLKVAIGDHRLVALQFYNLIGQLLRTSSNLDNDISEFQNGTYLVVITTDTGTFSKKLVIQK